MNKQRLGERFSGTRYVAMVEADSMGVSGTARFEDDAIWDAAQAAGWPWRNGMRRGVLIRLKLTEREDVVQDGWCPITAEDIEQIELDILEDGDE